MNSLHRRLTVSLWVALLAVGSLSAAFAYLHAERDTRALLDDQLEQVARLAAVGNGPAASPLMAPALDRDDDLLVTVRDAAGHVRLSMGASFPLPPAADGFSEEVIEGESYRLFGPRFVATSR